MKRTLWVVLALLGIGLGIWSCKKAPEPHTTVGVIREIRPDRRIFVIEHEDFPGGFMKAMTMPFELKDPTIAEGLAIGDKVEFTVIAVDNGYSLTAIKKKVD